MESLNSRRLSFLQRGTGGLLALDAVAVIAVATSSRVPVEHFPAWPLTMFMLALPLLVLSYVYLGIPGAETATMNAPRWAKWGAYNANLLGLVMMFTGFVHLAWSIDVTIAIAFTVVSVGAFAVSLVLVWKSPYGVGGKQSDMSSDE